MAEQGRDIVIIGGGHNGLVTAFYLAKAGLQAAGAGAQRAGRRGRGHRRIPSRISLFDAGPHGGTDSARASCATCNWRSMGSG